jgi:hypothetical protein
MTEQEKLGQRYLEAAFAKMHEIYLEENPPVEGDVVYSPKYIKAINKLFEKKEKRHTRWFDSVYKKVVAIIVAAMITIGSGVCVYAFQEPIAEFIAEIKDKFVEIFFGEADISKAPTEIETVYTLGYVPDGYTLESSENMRIRATTIWSNGEDEVVLWQYLISNKETFDNEISDYKTIWISDIKLNYIEKYEDKYFYWNNAEYVFELSVPNNISNDECIDIIESLKND